MKFIVDLATIPDNITAIEFMILVCKKHNIVMPEDLDVAQLHNLQAQGYVKVTNYEEFEFDLREKANTLLEVIEIFEEAQDSAIENWIDDYRRLFKDARNAPGIMGDRAGCIKKMKAFMKAYRKYTKDDIIKAAEYYISTINNPMYLQQADYFISKNSNSRLASFCEELQEKGNETTTTFYETI